MVGKGFFVKGIFMQSSTETEEETVNEYGEELASQVIKYTKSLRRAHLRSNK